MTGAPVNKGEKQSPGADRDNIISIKSLPRKLSAILHADVVGYSAMTNEDEEGTYALLRASLDAATELILAHGGKAVNYAGDAILADFPTASGALACALDIQKTHRGEDADHASAIKYRIGINLGYFSLLPINAKPLAELAQILGVERGINMISVIQPVFR